MSDIQDSPNWIRSIPDGWRLVPLGALFDERKEAVSDSEFPALSVTKRGVVPQLSDVAKTQNGDSRKLVRSGDFVINSRSDRKGSSGISEQDGSVSVVYTVLRPREGLDTTFVHHLLRSSAFQEEFYRWGSGIVADLWSTRYPAMKKIMLPTPSLDEQRDIACFLDRETQKIDELITEQRGLIETLRELRIATISRTVRSGLNPEAETQASGVDWLGSVPAHWEVKRLKYSVESAVPGVWGSDPAGDETDVRCVRVADFDRSRLRVGNEIETIRSVDLKNRKSRELQRGDLLIEKSGGTAINPVGFVAMYEGGSELTVYANFIARMRPVVGQVPRYWLYAHAASYATRLTFRSVKQTTGIQNLDQSAYFDELFPYPPPEEQCAIVDYLDEQTVRIDELISESEDLITLSQERRAALITAAVTGQIDVGEAL